RALAGEPITIYGDGRQVRDILEVGDAVKAYLAAWRRMEATKGKALNLGGGVANAVSLRRLIQHIETLTGAKVDVEYEDWRTGDQRYFVADATDAKSLLGLPEPLEWRLGVKRLAKWMGADLRSRRKASETVAA